jgi:amino-acid N-acetyltransferase
MAALRKPTVFDVPAILALMGPHARSEKLLPRSREHVVERLRDYTVAEEAGRVVGVASVALVAVHLAEVGVLVARDRSVEEELLAGVLEEATALGVGGAFVLTDDPAPFRAAGFSQSSLARLPEKRDRQCLRCPRAPTCRQVALERPLTGGQRLAAK